MASLGVHGASKSCLSAAARFIGSRAFGSEPVSMLGCDDRLTVPRERSFLGSSFLAPSPLQSSFVLIPARSLSGPSVAAWVLGPLRDIAERVHLPRRSPTLVTFRPQAFSASRRFTPLSGSRACFISQPRSGPIPFRGFSLRAAVLSRRKASCPLDVQSPSTHRAFAQWPQAAPATSRLCSTRSSVPSGRCLAFPRPLPSSSFALLQVPLPR